MVEPGLEVQGEAVPEGSVLRALRNVVQLSMLNLSLLKHLLRPLKLLMSLKLSSFLGSPKTGTQYFVAPRCYFLVFLPYSCPHCQLRSALPRCVPCERRRFRLCVREVEVLN